MTAKAEVIQIDERTRNYFLNELDDGNYATIDFLMSLKKQVPSIEVLNRAFRDGDLGARDPQRAQIHRSAGALPTGFKRILSALLETDRMGKQGWGAPYEVCAEAVRLLTGGLCSHKTFEKYIRGLEKEGWVSISHIRTGTKYYNSGKWGHRKISLISLRQPARLLNATQPLTRARCSESLDETSHTVTREPSGSPELRTRCATEAHNSRPPEKIGTTEGHSSNGEPKGSLVTVCDVSSNDSEQRARVKRGTEVSGKPDKSTSPRRSASTGKQRASRSATRKAAKSAAAVRGAAHQTRTKAPHTWDSAQRTFLKQLFEFCHDRTDAVELHRIAKLQTDRRYPAAYPAAKLDWNRVIWKWLDMDWHQRRRFLKHVVMPPLVAFCAHLHPPDRRELQRGDISESRRREIEERTKRYRELGEWLRVVPMHLSGIPLELKNRIEQERFALDSMARRINEGQCTLDDLSEEHHYLLQHLRFLQQN